MEEMVQNNSRSREIAGVIILALAFFFFLSLVSYRPEDPSLTHYAGSDVDTKNIFGTVGSYTADALIRLLGISIFLLPILLVVAAFKYLVQETFRFERPFIAGAMGLFLSLSGLIQLILPNMTLYGASLLTGGLVGRFSADILRAYLNKGGALAIFLLILTLSLIVVVNFSILKAGQKTVALGKWSWAGVRGMLAALFKESEAVSAPVADAEPNVPKIEPAIDEPQTSTARSKRKKSEQINFDFLMEGGVFNPPPLSLLDDVERRDTRLKRESLIMNSRLLEKKLSDFGVEAKVTEVKPGPIVTMYELEPAPGVKINRITNLSDDLALALRSPTSNIRIVAPIPGKAAIGIEIPNLERDTVHLRDVLDSEAFQESRLRLPIALGEDIVGIPFVTDLVKMPHLLIAGTTGSGKSVFLHAIICSILFKASPDEVKFLIIDPKRVELSAYEGLPHLLHPVVMDPKKASLVLKWAVEEMERRYRIFGEAGVKGIDSHNRQIEKDRTDREKRTALEKMRNPQDSDVETDEALRLVKLPYIVIIIDELADLIMVAQRNVEESLARLAQMARAAGIHLVIATQRPSVDVITGVIKANFPTRISFQVSSKVDSRTILDQLGAENLLGDGDMLFIPPGTSKMTRIHGAFVSDKEIGRIAEFIRKQRAPAYDASLVEFRADTAGDDDKSPDAFDEKYDEAVELVTDLGQASISLVQRYLKVGYNRAARIIERMEVEGVVGPSDGVKPRKVLVRKMPR